ncbi:MAG: class I SAM-dependent methyltransferase [Nanobdellota archaeon]
MRRLVAEGYNKGNYDEVYGRKDDVPGSFQKLMCDELIARTTGNFSILGLGCGTGLPFDAYFTNKGFSVTGLDISEKHIRKARKNVSSAEFILGDFFSKKIKGKFDAIVSFYSIFHIPREEHKSLFRHMHSLLKKNGYILITLGAESMKCDVSEDFAGSRMAWSSYSVQWNKKLIREAGFELIMAVEDHREESHLWILARKK